jgi:hypothetical protein
MIANLLRAKEAPFPTSLGNIQLSHFVVEAGVALECTRIIARRLRFRFQVAKRLLRSGLRVGKPTLLAVGKTECYTLNLLFAAATPFGSSFRSVTFRFRHP